MLALPNGAALTVPTRALGSDSVARAERREMRRHATGPTPGPPPPCGMQNVLCRFRCDTSAPILAGLGQADQRVQVRAVDINLPAVRHGRFRRSRAIASSNTPCVDGYVTMIAARSLACCLRLRLAGRRHRRCRCDRMRLTTTLHAAHAAPTPDWCRARDCRNQADVAMALAARAVIRADGQQARVFALRAGVGLQRLTAVVAGARDEHLLELGDQLPVAGRLLCRRERMNVRELGPRDRDHFGWSRSASSCTSRAGSSCDRARGRLSASRAQVAQHLVLASDAVEHRMRQKWRRAAQRGGQRSFRRTCRSRCRARRFRRRPPNSAPERHDVVARGRFVERDADIAVRASDVAQVDARGATPRVMQRVASRAAGDRDRVEERARRDVVAQPLQALREDRRRAGARAARSSSDLRGP